MNNPYGQNFEGDNEQNATQSTLNNEPKREPESQINESAQAQNTLNNDRQQYSQNSNYRQYTPPYGEQKQNAYSNEYSQYGYQRQQYSGYYGNSGYFGQQPPQAPTYAPYYRETTKPREKKPASKSFVIIMLVIAIIVSFVGNIIFCSVMHLTMNNGSIAYFTPGKVVLQYAPKNEQQEPITDKGVSAYVASVAANTVVEITTETIETDSYYGQYITQGAGSGVIVSSTEEGSFIITCAHVIDGAGKITVKLKDGITYQADSYICDPESDVGVIKLNVKGLPVATIGNFDEVVVGETVVAIGNPLGTLGGSVSNGIISALDRDIIIDGTTYHLLQTNAEINPGNSGGGLFNAKGELIGIVNAKSVAEDVEGLGFAIPVSDAVSVMTDLVEHGYVPGRVKLGFTLIELVTSEQAQNYFSKNIKFYRYFTEYGVYIVSSENKNFSEGDLLVAVDDVKIYSLSDLKALLQEYEVGQKVTVTVSRVVGHKTQLFNIELTLTEKK